MLQLQRFKIDGCSYSAFFSHPCGRWLAHMTLCQTSSESKANKK